MRKNLKSIPKGITIPYRYHNPLQNVADATLGRQSIRTGTTKDNAKGTVTAADIKYSDKFINQVSSRGWSNELITNTINTPH